VDRYEGAAPVRRTRRERVAEAHHAVAVERVADGMGTAFRAVHPGGVMAKDRSCECHDNPSPRRTVALFLAYLRNKSKPT
jgi:hypothetical protein